MFLFRILFSVLILFRSFSEEFLCVFLPPILSPVTGISVFNSSLRPLCLRVQSKTALKSSLATLCLCVQFLSLQAGFSFTPLPLEYDCAYLTLPMALDASSFDCVVGPGCSITMSVRVSVHDSALNEVYAYPLTFSHPCDLVPTETYNFIWPPGWFIYNGLIQGGTYWVQLEMLSFTTNSSATETYLLGNTLKITLEGAATYSQPTILTTQSFVYSPMVADFSWQKPKQNKIKALTNAAITLIDQSEIYGEVDYRWYLDGALIGTDSVVSYSAPCREHEIRLEVE